MTTGALITRDEIEDILTKSDAALQAIEASDEHPDPGSYDLKAGWPEGDVEALCAEVADARATVRALRAKWTRRRR